MGQEMSHRHTNDTLSLFPPLNGSAASLSNDYRFDDVFNNNYFENNKFKKSHRVSRLKKSLSECFKPKFSRLKEIDSDSYSGEIMNSQMAHSDKSNLVSQISCGPRGLTDANETLVSQDIRDIHDQLATLMQLLTQSGADSSLSRMRDVGTQTSGQEHVGGSISVLQGTLISLNVELTNKNQLIEKYAHELAVLKSTQTRHHIDTKSANGMLAFLRDVKERRRLAFVDLDKMDEIIEYVSSLLPSQRHSTEKSNVAVISPCSNSNGEQCAPLSPQTVYSMDPLCDGDGINETKLICFLDHSVTPYISAIPFSCSQITLSKVKYYTRSVLPKNANCRYIFRSASTSSGQRQEEISRDTDVVPVQDNKIVVRIRM